MTTITAFALEGCIPAPPSWMTGRVAQEWRLVQEFQALPEDQYASRITRSSYDVFTSWIEYLPQDVRHYQGILFQSEEEYARFGVAFTGFYDPDGICSEEIARFWVRRPSWYFPTRQEVTVIRSCVSLGLIELSRNLETFDEAYMEVAKGMTQIGLAVYSPLTSQVLASPETPVVPITEDLSLFFKAYMTHPVLIRLVNDAIQRSSESSHDADLVMQITRGDNLTDAAVLHASDYLDHEGHTAASLPVWRHVFMSLNTEARIDQLARMTVIKPEVVSDRGSSHMYRVTNYQRGMGRARNAWVDNFGFLISHVWSSANESGKQQIQECLPAGAEVEISDSMFLQRQLFYYLDAHQGAIQTFNMCFLGRILGGQVGIPNDEFMPTMVAKVLFMAKITSDPLAMIDWTIRNN